MEKGVLKSVIKKSAFALVAMAFLSLGGAVPMPWMEVANVRADSPLSGYCGRGWNEKEVEWTYSNKTLTLKGTGSGEMMDFSDILGTDRDPWKSFRSEVTTLVMDAGIKNADFSAFSGFTSLTDCNVEAGNVSYASKDGVLYDDQMNILCLCPLGKTGSISVPASVINFSEGAFWDEYNSTLEFAKISKIILEERSSGYLYSGDQNFHEAFTPKGKTYGGNILLCAPEGKEIVCEGNGSVRGAEKEMPAEYIVENASNVVHIIDQTKWDRLQDELSKGGLVTLTEDYDYSKDSYDYDIWTYKLAQWRTETYRFCELLIPAGTTIDLNGHTLKCSLMAEGDVTVKNGNFEGKFTVGDLAFDWKTGYNSRKDGKLTLDNVKARATRTPKPKQIIAGGVELTGPVSLIKSTLTIDPDANAWNLPSSGNAITLDAASEILIGQVDASKASDANPIFSKGPERFAFFNAYSGKDPESATKKGVERFNAAFKDYIPEGYMIKGTPLKLYSNADYYFLCYSFVDASGKYPESVTLKEKKDSFAVGLSNYSFTYNGKAKKPTVSVTYKGQPVNSKDYTVKWSGGRKKVGTYKVEVKGKSKAYKNIKGTAYFEITKAENPMTLQPKTVTIKLKKSSSAKPVQPVTDKKKTFAISKLVKVSKKKGSLSYQMSQNYELIDLDPKTGKFTVYPGLREGEHKYKIKISASGDQNHKEITKEVEFTVLVKY